MSTPSKKLNSEQLFKAEEFFSGYEGADKVITSTELMTQMEGKISSSYKAMTGLPSLDRMLDGVEVGELVVVTGPSGEGKTTLLMSITKNMAMAKEKCLWFTLEVTPQQFMEKLDIASAGNIPEFYIPQNALDMADDEYVKEWEKTHKRSYETMDWIEDKITEAKVKFDEEGKPVRVVFIDHVHMLFSLTKISQNLSLEVGDLVARIKYWALSKGLIIFLIAHCRDIPTEVSQREPRMGDIRDSGMISRLADTVLGVWRIPNSDDGHEKKRKQLIETDNKTKVVIFKNRRRGVLGYFPAYHHHHYITENAFIGTEFESNSMDF